jgi:hypothetical protein
MSNFNPENKRKGAKNLFLFRALPGSSRSNNPLYGFIYKPFAAMNFTKSRTRHE